jgi:hypothetical protein
MHNRTLADFNDKDFAEINAFEKPVEPAPDDGKLA